MLFWRIWSISWIVVKEHAGNAIEVPMPDEAFELLESCDLKFKRVNSQLSLMSIKISNQQFE
jgi:hypothetical protein